jgi:hypothetical protein
MATVYAIRIGLGMLVTIMKSVAIRNAKYVMDHMLLIAIVVQIMPPWMITHTANAHIIGQGMTAPYMQGSAQQFATAALALTATNASIA